MRLVGLLLALGLWVLLPDLAVWGLPLGGVCLAAAIVLAGIVADDEDAHR